MLNSRVSLMPSRARLEVELALHVIMRPELALDVPSSILGPTTEELVEIIALAPSLCREAGVDALVANCCTHPATYPVLQFLQWLLGTPKDIRDCLPPFDSVVSALAEANSRVAA